MKQNRTRARRVLAELERLYPNPRHYLVFENPYQLVVATILSAQCTDEKVNEVTATLFERYPGPEDLAREDLEAIEEAVRPTGFYRNKAKSIRGAAAAIVERFGGRVPGTMDELVTIPGIARKSANAVLQNAFEKVEGIVVDTHVIRLARRLGWTDEKDPVKIERDLMALFGRDAWRWLPFYLKNHGRAVCRAPTPRCGECVVNPLCPSALFDLAGPGKDGKRKTAPKRKAAGKTKTARRARGAATRKTAPKRKAKPKRTPARPGTAKRKKR